MEGIKADEFEVAGHIVPTVRQQGEMKAVLTQILSSFLLSPTRLPTEWCHPRLGRVFPPQLIRLPLTAVPGLVSWAIPGSVKLTVNTKHCTDIVQFTPSGSILLSCNAMSQTGYWPRFSHDGKHWYWEKIPWVILKASVPSQVNATTPAIYPRGPPICSLESFTCYRNVLVCVLTSAGLLLCFMVLKTGPRSSCTRQVLYFWAPLSSLRGDNFCPVFHLGDTLLWPSAAELIILVAIYGY